MENVTAIRKTMAIIKTETMKHLKASDVEKVAVALFEAGLITKKLMKVVKKN